ncbi:MAG: AAA family ATPase [Actinomycetota bacterium]
MGANIAVAGKGGTGKTTLCGLLIRSLTDSGRYPVLALDADPNSNLNQILGIDSVTTVGMLREDFKKNASRMDKGIYKDQLVEMNLQQALVESKKFDLLVMGRGEGPGCYCYANSLFRKYIDTLQDNYDYVVMDNEAGMEHLSRRTTQDIDCLVIVSDPSPKGIMTASRIKGLAGELNLKVGRVLTVINRAPEKLDQRLVDFMDEKGLELAAVINNDPSIFDMDISSGSVFDLPQQSKALEQAGSLLREIGLL